MKNRGLILLLSLLAVLFVRLEASSGLRIKIFGESSFTEPFNWNSDTYTYHYAPDSFAVVDSVVLSTNTFWGGPYLTTYTCQTTVTYPAPGHCRYDYIFYRPNGTQSHSEGYETDVWGRKVYEYKDGNDITRYYPDGPGWRADSLEYRWQIGTNVSYTKLIYEYDSQGRRFRGYKYSRSGSNPWEYVGYYQNSFDGSLPFPIDTEQVGPEHGCMRRLALMLDKQERVSLLEFYRASGVPSSWAIGYSDSEGNFSYDWTYQDESDSNLENLVFYPNGKIRRHYKSYSNEWHGSSSSTWYQWEWYPLPNSDELSIPVAVTLYPNYPNPFNPSTTIAFHLAQASSASLTIYNAKGQLVKTLLSDTFLSAGKHSYSWDGKDKAGREVATGMYLTCLRAGGKSLSRKMMLIK